MKKTIMLTGATGYIGGNLLQKLIAREDIEKIHCLVRNPNKLNPKTHPKVAIFSGDITDKDSLLKAMKGTDLVFHLAAFYQLGISKSEIKNMESINIEGTRNVLQAAKELNIPQTVYVSTVYALGETSEEIADENFKHRGSFTSHYERTKYEAHKVAEEFIKDGLPLSIVLPSGVYGENDPSILGLTISKLAKGKFPGFVCGTEKNKLTYVHVDDLTSGILLVADKGKRGEQYILAGDVMSYEEMMNAITSLAGSKKPKLKIPYVMAKSAAYVDEAISHRRGKSPFFSQEALNSMQVSFAVSSQKAQNELGFSPRKNIDGFRAVVRSIV